jgi:hypothetical protein
MEAPFDRTGIVSDPVRRTKFVGARPVWTHVQLRAGRTDFRVLGTKVKNDLNVDEIGTTACLKNSLLCVQLGCRRRLR